MKAANAQGWDDVTWLYLTSVYSENFAEAIDDAGAGIYVPAEFYPFTDDSEINSDWRTLMEDNDIPLTLVQPRVATSRRPTSSRC